MNEYIVQLEYFDWFFIPFAAKFLQITPIYSLAILIVVRAIFIDFVPIFSISSNADTKFTRYLKQ